MKEYNIVTAENELEVQFRFRKSSLISMSVFSLFVFAVFFIFSKPGAVYNSWRSLVFMFCLLFYLTFEGYFEWRKFKHHKIQIAGEDLIINGQKLYKTFNIKTVNVIYCNSRYAGGWTVYLCTHYSKKDYIIHKRLKERDALDIAKKIAKFLEKEILVEN